MIKVKKTKIPPILEKNAEIWTKKYCDYLKDNKIPPKTLANKYNNEQIKTALEKETHGKCVYCEGKIKHISYGDIEHIIPKSVHPELYLDWNNLTLACEQCNRSGKGTYYDSELPLINPYIEDPEDYLIDMGPLIMAKPSSDRAHITIDVLKLNRSALFEQRREKIEKLDPLVQLWSKTTNQQYKNVLAEQIREEISEDKEYASTIKGYLKNVGFPLE